MASFKQEYRTIRLNLLMQRDLLEGMIRLFRADDFHRMKKFALELCKESRFQKAISGTLFPNSVAELGECGTMPWFRDLDRGLLWYTLVLKNHAKEINIFLHQKAEFDHMFLLGQYDQCFILLDKCNQQFGWSLWEIKNRIALLNESEGLNAQKQFMKDALRDSKIGTIMYYLVNCFSRQCEQNVSVHTYLSGIQADYNRMKSQGYPVQMYKYAKYKAQGYVMCTQSEIDFLDEGTIGYFLYEDGGYALVDRYLSFFNLVSDVYEWGSKKLREIFTPYVFMLSNEIQDPFLHNISYLEQKHYPPFYTRDTNSICQAYDSYAIGNYQTCLEITGDMLLRDVAFFPMVEIYAKSSTYLSEYVPLLSGTENILNKIIDKLRQLFIRSEDVTVTQISLMKLLYTQLDTIWSRELMIILRKYNSRLMVLEERQLKNYFSSISTADSIFQFPFEFLNSYLMEAPSTYHESVATQLSVAVRTSDLDKLSGCSIEHVRKAKYQASLLIETSPEKAIEILNQTRARLEPGARRLEIDALRIKTYLKLENLLDAMDIFIEAFYENHNFIYIGSIDRIFENIKSQDYDVQDSILTPILCSLYFNYYPQRDDRDDIIWTMCYEEYLRANGVQKPSELLSIIGDKVSDTNLIHFLAEVCLPNTMDRSPVFAAYDEVLQERTLICEELIKRDPSHATSYEDELHRLTKRLLIRMAKREVENGKIYVDLEGIRQLMTKEVGERYKRYVDFRESNLTEFVIRFIEIRENEKTENIRCFFTGKDTKQIDMLQEIIKQIRDIFVADNKYGLDGCLSVRIRHGTLESQLRSCFERHNLITTKSPDGLYKENKFWYTGKPESAVLEINNKVFAHFSAHVDEVIKTLKTDMLQIRTEEKNDQALFDFTIDRNFVERIGDNICNDLTFEAFVDMMLQEMLAMTDAGLKQVQAVLEKQIDVRFQTALIELENSLDGQEKHYFNFRGLRDSIAKARTEIASELKHVGQWFRLTQTDSYSDYQLSLAISISHELIENSHSGSILIYEKYDIDESIRLRGQTLPNIVDIFNIMFDNVIKHSSLQNKFHVQLRAYQEDDRIIILMENHIEHGCLDPAHLREVEAQLSNWDQSDYVNKEGGSGLYKIKKILSIDLHSKNNITLNCKNDVFSIKISAELKGVLL